MVVVPQVLIGLVLLIGGVVGYTYAYEITRFSERLDAIGSTTSWEAVEPANWKVIFTQLMSLFLILVGGMFLLTGVF